MDTGGKTLRPGKVAATLLAYFLVTLLLGGIFAISIGKEVSTPAFRYVGF
jgi:hypothetical protein